MTWILFLRVLDETEQREQRENVILGRAFVPSLTAPYRWRDWGAPAGTKRNALQDQPQGAFFTFVNQEFLPHLKALETQPDASVRQKLISEIMRGVERTRIDTEKNFRDAGEPGPARHRPSAHLVRQYPDR